MHNSISGVFVAHYLQNVTKNLALGAECIYQRMGAQHGGPTALTSLAARYTGEFLLHRNIIYFCIFLTGCLLEISFFQ